MSWFGKKEEEKKQHPWFPKMPLGIRLNGLIKFKTSFYTQFLLNDGKMYMITPSEQDCVVKAVSNFNLFGLNTYRAYLSTTPKSILQIHCDHEEVLDAIFYQQTEDINLAFDSEARNFWNEILGNSTMTVKTASEKEYTYNRCWSADVRKYGERVDLVTINEKMFETDTDQTEIHNRAMMYERILENGSEDDIEYLLIALRNWIDYKRVLVLAGTVVPIDQIEVY